MKGVVLLTLCAMGCVSGVLGEGSLKRPFLFASSSSLAYPKKLSAYECGFDPLDDARSRFDIRFYLVSILFIIFDLEVTF